MEASTSRGSTRLHNSPKDYRRHKAPHINGRKRFPAVTNRSSQEHKHDKAFACMTPRSMPCRLGRKANSPRMLTTSRRAFQSGV